MTSQQRHSELAKQIKQYDREYYELDKPTITDRQYDDLMKELNQLEEKNPELKTWASPSHRVGGDLLPGFEHVKHIVPMLSLDNIFEDEELMRRLRDMAEAHKGDGDIWIVEPKIDGLSLDLEYQNEVLVRALTRGNGEIGDDVTENARTIRSIPLQLSVLYPDNKTKTVLPHVHIRGEVFMTYSAFNKVNQERSAAGQELLSNPRNAASGALKLIDPKECSKRRLSFVPYHVAYADKKSPIPETQNLLHLWLASLGFTTMTYPSYNSFSKIEKAVDWIREFNQARKDLPYPTDGAVIKLNHLASREDLGAGSRAVKWGYAFKYAAETAETVLKAITIQVGRTGILAPVAELEPIELCGTTVKRASLHNQDMVRLMDIHPGDTVEVRKAGEIIPEVVRLTKVGPRTSTFHFPTECPICGSKVIRATVSDEEKEAVALVCSNTINCPAQIRGRLEHWCSKRAMDIQDVGPVLISNLVGAGIRKPDQLYRIDREFLLTLPGVASSKAAHTLESISVSKDRGLEKVLVGLGIPRNGRTSAKKIARVVKNMTELMSTSMEDLQQATGLGDVLIDCLRTWFQSSDNQKLVLELEKAGVNMDSKTYNPGTITGAFAGKTVVFTGGLEEMDRAQAQAMVEQQGGRCSSSVSKKTDYVVVGSEPGSKYTKAQELGIRILTEEEFLEMINQ